MDASRVVTAAAVLVAGLVVAVALTAGIAVSEDGVANDTSTVVTTDGGSSYLSPPAAEVTREGYSSPGFDLSAAAAADSQRLRGEHRAAMFEQRFEAAGNRSELVVSAAARLGDRADALDGHHGGLLATYSEGELSTPRLLAHLAQTRAAAVQHQTVADRIETVVANADNVALPQDIQEQFSTLAVELPALESPVTDALVDGQLDPGQTVYAQATDDAVVLAVAGETHIRQATLRGERDRGGVNRFIQDAGEDENPNTLALDRSQELYPGLEVFSPPPFDATTVYGIQSTTAFGEVVAYLDGATRNSFHEQQRLTAAELPVTDVLTESADDIELTVETTSPTGPMRVTVTDGDEPVEGVRLSVADDTVGVTDAAGGRWVTQPLDGATVSVTVDEQTLELTLPA